MLISSQQALPTRAKKPWSALRARGVARPRRVVTLLVLLAIISSGSIAIGRAPASAAPRAIPKKYVVFVKKQCKEEDDLARQELLRVDARGRTLVLKPCDFGDGYTVWTDRSGIESLVVQGGFGLGVDGVDICRSRCNRLPLRLHALRAGSIGALALSHDRRRVLVAGTYPYANTGYREGYWEYRRSDGKLLRFLNPPHGWRIVAIANDGNSMLFERSEGSSDRSGLYVGSLSGAKRELLASNRNKTVAFDGARVVQQAWASPTPCTVLDIRSGTTDRIPCPRNTVAVALAD